MSAEDYLDRLSADAPRAVELSEEAALAFPDDHRILRARAIILRLAKRRVEAEQHLLAVIERFPTAHWAHAQLGLVHSPAEAIPHFRKALEMDPHNRDYRLALIHVLSRYMGDGSDAMLEEAYQLLKPMLAGASSWAQNDLHIAYHTLSRVCAWGEMDLLGTPAELGRKWSEAGNHTALLLLLGRVRPAPQPVPKEQSGADAV